MAVGSISKFWATVWTKPRETIRQIITINPALYFLPLCAIYGFPILIHIARFFALGASLPGWSILLMAIVLSPIAGFIGISFWSLLLLWTGKWIKGKANYEKVRASVAWANVPNVVNVAVWLILGLTMGAGLFMPGFGAAISVGMARFILVLSMIQLVAMIWGLVILLIMLSEVQKFSIWRAIANIAMPCVILVVLSYILNSILYGMQS